MIHLAFGKLSNSFRVDGNELLWVGYVGGPLIGLLIVDVLYRDVSSARRYFSAGISLAGLTSLLIPAIVLAGGGMNDLDSSAQIWGVVAYVFLFAAVCMIHPVALIWYALLVASWIFFLGHHEAR